MKSAESMHWSRGCSGGFLIEWVTGQREKKKEGGCDEKVECPMHRTRCGALDGVSDSARGREVVVEEESGAVVTVSVGSRGAWKKLQEATTLGQV